jgi:hypothetical protein
VKTVFLLSSIFRDMASDVHSPTAYWYVTFRGYRRGLAARSMEQVYLQSRAETAERSLGETASITRQATKPPGVMVDSQTQSPGTVARLTFGMQALDCNTADFSSG